MSAGQASLLIAQQFSKLNAFSYKKIIAEIPHAIHERFPGKTAAG
jgi:hypothetical protein